VRSLLQRASSQRWDKWHFCPATTSSALTVLLGGKLMEGTQQASSAKAPRRHRFRHHRGNRHRQQRENSSDQATSQQVTGVSKPVLIEEPGVEATAELDGSALQVGVISTREHVEVVDALATTCCSELMLKGVESHKLHVGQVLSSTELPYAAKQLICAAPEPLDVVIVVGCWLGGDCFSKPALTDAVTSAIIAVSLATKTPVVNGVLNCKNVAPMCWSGGEDRQLRR
jgi:6,7-dimethyl-8-ribityllumazine synthase